jgi:hypothetical protein
MYPAFSVCVKESGDYQFVFFRKLEEKYFVVTGRIGCERER